MASKNQVTLTFVGDSEKLEKSFDNVGKGAQNMGRQAEEGGRGLDRLEEAGGTTETRFLGLGAGISGVSTLLSGDLNAETAAMAMADLGDAVEHTIAPMLKHAKQWVTMGITATVNAAKMAAAWLISLGPIALVIGAVAAVIAILVALGVGFDDVKNAASAVWNWIKKNWPLLLAILTGPIGLAVLAIFRHRDSIIGAFRSAFDFAKRFATSAKDWIVARFNDVVSFFRDMPERVARAFAGIGRAIVNGIKSVWNSTIGGFGFDVPSWIPGIGGRSFRIPRLHQGGIVPGAPGTETLALLQAGERVTRAGAGGPSVVIDMRGAVIADGRQFEQMVVRAIRSATGKGVPLTVNGRAL